MVLSPDKSHIIATLGGNMDRSLILYVNTTLGGVHFLGVTSYYVIPKNGHIFLSPRHLAHLVTW